MTRTASSAPVLVADAPLTVDDILGVAAGARLELAKPAIDRILASRAVVDDLVGGEQLIYGLNTGLGNLRDQRMPLDTLREYQDAIVRTHAGGIGPPLPVAVVRAAMCVRVAGIARGGAGASLAVAEKLVAMLNLGVHPVVPTIGSVGASDLMHMAAIGMVAIGRGRAEVGGIVMPGAEALALAGIEPVVLEPKDGLALVSANGVSIGHGALVVDRAARAADNADIVAALSLEAARGNPSIVEPVVASAKPIAGQLESARRIRALLDGSSLCLAGGPASIQDPLSFRVLPQVHGALRELVGFARKAVDDELASIDDNPMVVVEEHRMASNGNFHPILMALAFDALRPGLAHAGLLSEHRSGHHFDSFATTPEAFADGGVLLAAMVGGATLMRYSAAARSSELRGLAEPATLDIPMLDVGVEDHSTNAPLTVRRTDETLDVVDDLLAVELVIGWMLLRRIEGVEHKLGSGTSPVLQAIDAALAGLGAEPASEDMHAAVRGVLADGTLEAAASLR
ncbi:MAG: aromatic amino acid lyase [Candidatus Dormibacteraeota bacterium]|nr:aromatic amino acid lyase [Candidatus Dormibacteraeota bacterium]